MRMQAEDKFFAGVLGVAAVWSVIIFILYVAITACVVALAGDLIGIWDVVGFV